MLKNTGAGKNSKQIRVLSISPNQDDHFGLGQIFARAEWGGDPESQWTLESSYSLRAAIPMIDKQVQVVICESEPGNESWKELLEQLSALSDPPCLIVTSRRADERLWSEALNLGAYDVLAKPFDTNEVVRVLRSAWLNGQHRRERKAKAAAAGAFAPLSLEAAM